MASKNVALRMDVVRILDRIRRPSESYSDVIERHVAPKPSWSEIFQTLKDNRDDGPDELSSHVRDVRRELNRSFEERRKRHAKVP
jgi:predicted CopG family antitoxin